MLGKIEFVDNKVSYNIPTVAVADAARALAEYVDRTDEAEIIKHLSLSNPDVFNRLHNLFHRVGGE